MLKIALSCIFFIILQQILAQEAQFPVVKNFGGIYEIERATTFADPTLDYKIVVDIMSGSATHDKINPALNNLARLLNLHGLNGTSMEKIALVAVVHNLATESLLADEVYSEKFGIKNPNTLLLDELSAVGVKIFVCGQSLRARGFENTPLHPNTEVSISALTILTTFQMQGYAALKF